MTEEKRPERLIQWLGLIYRDVQGIFEKNPRLADTSGLFNQWMASVFVQSAAFNDNYDRSLGPELPQLEPSKLQAEVDELLAKTDQIRHHFDRRFAHYDHQLVRRWRLSGRRYWPPPGHLANGVTLENSRETNVRPCEPPGRARSMHEIRLRLRSQGLTHKSSGERTTGTASHSG